MPRHLDSKFMRPDAEGDGLAEQGGGASPYQGNQQFTVECWVRFNGVGVNVETLVSRWQTGNNRSFWFYVNNAGGMAFQYKHDSNNSTELLQRFPDIAFVADTWYHLALAGDFPANRARFFVNGVQQGADLAPTLILESGSTADFTIGKSPAGFGASDGLDGDISEVRLWHVERTPAQVLDWHNKILQPTDWPNADLPGLFYLDTEFDGSLDNFNATQLKGNVTFPVHNEDNRPFPQPITWSVEVLRADRAYLQGDSGDAWANMTGDFTMEWWLKLLALPTTGQTYALFHADASVSTEVIQIDLVNDGGTMKLRARCQSNNNGLAAGAAEHVQVEFDISGLLTAAGTWYHLALTADMGAAAATMYELFFGDESTTPASQGNGTVLSGTGCPSTPGGSRVVRAFGQNDGGASSFNGRVFNWITWDDVRTLGELQANYLLQRQQWPAEPEIISAHFVGSISPWGEHIVDSGKDSNNLQQQIGERVFVPDVPANLTADNLTADASLIPTPLAVYRASMQSTDDAKLTTALTTITLGGYRGALQSTDDAEVFSLGFSVSTKETVKPVLSGITPAGILNAASTPIMFDVTDPVNPIDQPAAAGVFLVVIWVRYAPPYDQQTLLAYDGANFVAPFVGNSSRTIIPNGFRFEILPVGGWAANIDQVFVRALDGDGNLEGTL